MSTEKMATCLVNVIKKCKQSSKEAVENIHEFSSFKQYMHVERAVEKELETLIDEASKSPISQLILVCGGVGDGKSHIISYLKQKHSDKLIGFNIHNDATESFEPQKTSIQTLADEFKNFSDAGLESGTVSKAILAINLGALNNFIDSDEGQAFSKLREFVDRKKILESAVVDNSFEPESPFQFVNFSDFHMFQLTESGPKSGYIKQLIQKLTDSDSQNIFYQVYRDNCTSGCPVSYQCPIKQNYELLSRDLVQDRIISFLLETVIKEKLIISTRALLNLFHDLIVAPMYEGRTDDQVKELVRSLEFNEYVNQLLPMLLFTKPESSPILSTISKQSPSRMRSEILDQRYIDFRSREDGTTVYQENIALEHFPFFADQLSLHSPWKNFDILSDEEIKKQETLKNNLVRLFVYMYYLVPKNENACFSDEHYDRFMKYLFYWNSEQYSKLRSLYFEVRDAIYRWDGEGGSNHTFVKIGKAQTQYQTLQKLEIEPFVPPHNGETDYPKILEKFLTSINLQYKPKNKSAAKSMYPSIEMDHLLYKLLLRIREGYRPNKNDKLRFIKFVEFMNKLNLFGDQLEEILFEEVRGDRKIKYVLRYESDFDHYSFLKEM